MSNEAFGAALGSSKRTAARSIAGESTPSVKQVATLARLVYPKDAALAATLAAAASTSLEALGLRAPPRAPLSGVAMWRSWTRSCALRRTRWRSAPGVARRGCARRSRGPGRWGSIRSSSRRRSRAKRRRSARRGLRIDAAAPTAPHVSPASTPSFVDANGVRFAFFEEGRGPLVLLVHGFPDTAHTWDEVRPAVAAAGYRVVTPFTRGYAPTAIPADGAYDSDTLGRDVLALIGALGESRAVSWGTTGARAPRTRPRRWSPSGSRSSSRSPSRIPRRSARRRARSGAFATSSRCELPGAAPRCARTTSRTSTSSVQRWSPAWSVPAARRTR